MGVQFCYLETGQLPPVMDIPLYTTVTRSDLSDQGYRAYSQFEKAFTLTQVMRQAGQDPEQIRFHNILLHLRNAEVTVENFATSHGANTNKDSRSVSIC